MIDKQTEIKGIVETMLRCNITVEEVSKQFHQAFKEDSPFDLLCIYEGELRRVSFETGKDLKPIGIFPDKTSPYYLCLEKKLGRRSSLIIDESKIPPIDFFKLLFAKRQLLKKAFMELGITNLDGSYLTNCKIYPNTEWHTVGFYCQNLKMYSRYVGDNDEYVSVRYFGIFTN